MTTTTIAITQQQHHHLVWYDTSRSAFSSSSLVGVVVMACYFSGSRALLKSWCLEPYGGCGTCHMVYWPSPPPSSHPQPWQPAMGGALIIRAEGRAALPLPPPPGFRPSRSQATVFCHQSSSSPSLRSPSQFLSTKVRRGQRVSEVNE